MTLLLQDSLVISPQTAQHLQEQIDAIEAASDVTDVVATYAELEAYDTSTLTDKDIIKVLADETHEDNQTYYRYNESSDDFTYIGELGPYYTKSESDTLLAAKQDTLVNQENIKSINGDSILGSGNLEIAAHLVFPSSWPTTNQTTTKAFCDAVAADTSAVEGKMYLGEVYWNDMPNGLVNSECVVEIMKGITAQNKIIVLTLTSGNCVPYLWKYTYWNGGSNVSSWKGFVPTTDVADKIYGTDANGLQTTYNKDDFGKIDDVRLNGTSVVENKIADIKAIPQYSSMPTASASNIDEIAQYSGEDIPDIEENATIEQTVGNSLTNLSVNVDTFVYGENPSDGDVVDFVANVTTTPASLSAVVNSGSFSITSTNANTFASFVTSEGVSLDNFTSGTAIYNYIEDIDPETGDPMPMEEYWLFDDELSGETVRVDIFGGQTLADIGIIASGSYSDGNQIGWGYSAGSSTISWEKNGEQVADLEADYGVSYTGTPENGDTLEVIYTSAKTGYKNGYFYKSSIEYSDPTATISQTVGSGLSDLAVNVDTFIEAEQPTQDETVGFTATVIQDSFTYSPDVVSDPNDYLFIHTRELLGTDGIYMNVMSVDDNVATGIQVFNAQGGFYTLYQQDLVDNNVVISNVSASDTIYATFVQGTTTWEKDSESVDLAEYGISYSGTPVDGDTLTVDYTVPVPIGYSWNQTDVQPSSGGGSAGIEWKTKVDLPVEYTGDWSGCTAYWTIAGGLPDGEYEFYFSTKCTDNNYSPIGEVVFKVVVKIDNEQNTFHGRMGYVFDGNYMNDSSYDVYGTGREWYNLFHKYNNDLIIYCRETPFACTIFDYISPKVLIKDCWKLSAIKNVETGQEYVATGNLNLDGSYPTYTQDMYGSIILSRLVHDPYIPPTTTWNSQQVENLQNNTFAFRLECAFAVLTVKKDDGSSEFIAKWYGERNGNGGMPYSQEIIKATGIFENSYLAYTTSYVYLMGVDTATAATLSGVVWATLGGFDVNGVEVWFNTIPQSVAQISQCGPQGYRLGTITPDGISNIVQYTGETNANYTNGYNYKATGTVVTIPESISPSGYNYQDWVCGVTNLNNLVNAISNVTGWSPSYIRNQMAYNNYWYYDINFDSQSTTITGVGFNFWNTNDQSVLQYLTAVYSGSASSGNMQVTFSPNYMLEHKEVQNPSWDQIDVQPNSNIQVSSMPLASDVSVGTVLQYAGETNQDYTNSYFYKCEKLYTLVGPAEDATEGEPGESMVFSLDADAFAAYLQTQGITLSGQTTFYLAQESDGYTGDPIYILQDGNYDTISEFLDLSNMASTTGITWGGQDDLTGDFPYIAENATGFIVGTSYAWEQTNVQPTPSGLPDQTGQSGKFLTTDGTDASWSDKPLVNQGVSSEALMIAPSQFTTTVTGNSTFLNTGIYNSSAFSVNGAVSIGGYYMYNLKPGDYTVGINGKPYSQYSIAINGNVDSDSQYGIGIGGAVLSNAQYAIQLGYGSNSNANTFKVANTNGNFEIMSADGTVPSDRTAPVTEILTTTVVQALADKYIYNCGEMTSVEVTLPATIPVNFSAQLNFTSGSTATTFTAPNTIKWLGDNVSTTFTPTTNKRYTVLFYSDGVNVRGLVQAVAA